MAMRLVSPGDLILNQATNGDDALLGHRATESSPTGNFIRLRNSTDTTDLFVIDITGSVTTGIIPAARLTGQLPATNFPVLTGDVTTAGGSLSTTVAKINGVTLSNSPSAANQVLVSSSASAASWGTIPNTALTNNSITFTSSGSISIGTASPALGGSTTLNINLGNAQTWTAAQTFSANTLSIPTWTTGTRPGVPVAQTFGWNSTLQQPEYYNAGWVNIGNLTASQISAAQVVKTLAATAPVTVSANTDSVTVAINTATGAALGAAMGGTGISVAAGAFSVVYGSTGTSAVAGNTQITVTAGTGMSGGGTITLGSGGTVTLTNAGVTSLTGTANQITASGSTGAVTISFPAAGVTLPSKTTLTASAAGQASLNIPTGVAPTVPVAGDVWLVNATGLYTYYNSATHLQADTDSAQTLTNKTISGASNTLSNIGNGSLTNSSITFTSSGSITIGTASPALGGSTTLNLNLGNAQTWTALQSFTPAIAVGTNPASTGLIRLSNAGTIIQRNAGNTADITLLSMDATGNGTWAQNWTITGNLTVNGTTTTINSSTLTVDDPQIVINNTGTIATGSAGTAGLAVYASDANGTTLSVIRLSAGGRWQAPATVATAGVAYGTPKTIALVGNADVVDSVVAGTGITVTGTGAGPYTGAVTVTLASALAGTLGGIQLAGDLAGTGSTAAAPKVGGLQGVGISITSLATNQVLQYNGTNWVNASLSSTLSWSGLTAPTGNQSLSMAGYTTTWTWGNATGAGTDMHVLTDTSGNTGTGAVIHTMTAATSAASPFMATARGAANGVYMDTTGNLQIMGTGKITANAYSGQLPIANGGTNSNTANGGFNNLSPMTTAGDIIYGGVAGAGTRLAANSTATKMYLQSVSGGNPSWQQIAVGDLSGTLGSGQLPADVVYNDVQTTITVQDTINVGTTPGLALLIGINALGGAGTRNSHWFQIRGQSYDTSPHAADWAQMVSMTSNAGASTYLWQSRVDAGALTTRASLTDAGVFNVSTGFQIAGAAGAAGNYLRSNGTNFVQNTIQATDLPTAGAASYGAIYLAGDLSGAANSPTVAKINGTTVSNTPAAANYVLLSTSSSAASWTNAIPNGALANSSITVTQGTGITVTGSPVALGGTVTITNAGVTNLSSSDSTITVSAATGATSITLPQSIATSASPTFTGLTLSGKVTSVHGSATSGNYGAAVDLQEANDSILASTSPTTVVTFTPSVKGNFIIYLYYRVITAATTLAVSLTFTDGSGAQTVNMVTGNQVVGSFAVAPLYINAVNGAAITVTATAGTANQVYVSSSIVGL